MTEYSVDMTLRLTDDLFGVVTEEHGDYYLVRVNGKMHIFAKGESLEKFAKGVLENIEAERARNSIETPEIPAMDLDSVDNEIKLAQAAIDRATKLIERMKE